MGLNIFDRIKEVADKDGKTVEQTALKLMEECGEVAEAVLSFEKAPACEYKGKTLDDIVEECCDVIIVAYTLVGSKYGIPKSVIEDRIGQKLNKWDKKITADVISQPMDRAYIIEVSAEQAFSLADSTQLLVQDGVVFRECTVQESINKETKIIRVNNSCDYYTKLSNELYESTTKFYVSPAVARVLEVMGK